MMFIGAQEFFKSSRFTSSTRITYNTHFYRVERLLAKLAHVIHPANEYKVQRLEARRLGTYSTSHCETRCNRLNVRLYLVLNTQAFNRLHLFSWSVHLNQWFDNLNHLPIHVMIYTHHVVHQKIRRTIGLLIQQNRAMRALLYRQTQRFNKVRRN